jgi:hypothetical protein
MYCNIGANTVQYIQDCTVKFIVSQEGVWKGSGDASSGKYYSCKKCFYYFENCIVTADGSISGPTG